MKKLLISISVLGSVALFAAPAFASVSITLSGANPQTVSQNHAYVDPGFSAFSTADGDLTGSVIFSSIDTSVLGHTTRTYSVTDSNLDSASASRNINVQGGGGQPWCAGPTAPGWNTNLPDGGCGGNVSIKAGQVVLLNGVPFSCPSYLENGCQIIKQ